MKTKKIAQLGSAFILTISSLLTLAMPLAHAAGPFTCTWTGAGIDTKFDTADNWTGCNGLHLTPQIGDNDNLIFPNSFTANNDLSGATFTSMTFQGGGTLTGNSFTLTGTGIDLTGTNKTIFLSMNIALSSSVTTTVAAGSDLYLAGVVSGASGAIVKAGLGNLALTESNTYSGSTTVNAGTLIAEKNTSLGDAVGATTVGSGADIILGDCHQSQSLTIAENITLTGVSSDTTANTGKPKLATCISARNPSLGNDSYGDIPSISLVTLSGAITLGSDITFGSSASTTTLSGTLTGSHSIQMFGGFPGKLIISSSSNGFSTGNGTYESDAINPTLSDSQPTHMIVVAGKTTLSIDGERSDASIYSGGTLKGTGKVGSLYVDAGATVAPGHSPGCLNTGNLTLLGTYQAEIGGTTACTGYDQLKVTGTVDVTSGTLTTSLYNSFVPAVGQSYTIIDNDAADAVTGTFTGLAEGATFTTTGVTYSITYKGGTGNDVVLTVTKVDASLLPKAPNTGLRLVSSSPVVTLAITLMAVATLGYISRRLNTTKR